MPLNLSHLVAALNQFPSYHAIDVFADDLGELRQRPPASLLPLDAQGRTFLATHQGSSFKLEIFPEQGVARLSRNGVPSTATAPVGGAIAGGLIGAAIDVAGKQRVPACSVDCSWDCWWAPRSVAPPAMLGGYSRSPTTTHRSSGGLTMVGCFGG